MIIVCSEFLDGVEGFEMGFKGGRFCVDIWFVFLRECFFVCFFDLVESVVER